MLPLLQVLLLSPGVPVEMGNVAVATEVPVAAAARARVPFVELEKAEPGSNCWRLVAG
jgi:hypothetical protein